MPKRSIIQFISIIKFNSFNVTNTKKIRPIILLLSRKNSTKFKERSAYIICDRNHGFNELTSKQMKIFHKRGNVYLSGKGSLVGTEVFTAFYGFRLSLFSVIQTNTYLNIIIDIMGIVFIWRNAMPPESALSRARFVHSLANIYNRYTQSAVYKY